ncbi:Hypothetical predicted protein [Octopus vulgaris]|uniref:Uncharacterized protein n=1 Tax=Octopus vulgaris TaxID=6645 RepID=A0AA36BH65_OCTVU|nr:Hypothetical predicted protein [Octopus vulgaris]
MEYEEKANLTLAAENRIGMFCHLNVGLVLGGERRTRQISNVICHIKSQLHHKKHHVESGFKVDSLRSTFRRPLDQCGCGTKTNTGIG